MGFCSNCGPFPCLCNIDDFDDESESTKLALMGKSESKHSKEQSHSEIMFVEAKDRCKSETMVNADVPMLRKGNYRH